MAWLLVLGPTIRACRKSTLQAGLDAATKNALSEWVTLPVQEVAAYPWCTECEHLRSGTCPKERLAKRAHVDWSPWYRCASKTDVPCPGRPDSSSDPEPEHWEWDLGKAGGYCQSVPEPPLPPQPTVPFQPGLPLQGSPSQSLWFPTGCDSPLGHPSLHAMWNLCAPASFWLRNQQQRSFNVAGSQAVGSRWTGTESPREEFASASRPLGTHRGRKRYNPGSYGGTAPPRRGGARTVAGAGSLQGSALADTASRAAPRSKTGGAIATTAMVST